MERTKRHMMDFKGGRFKKDLLHSFVIVSETPIDEFKRLLLISDEETFGLRCMRMDFQDSPMIKCYKFEKGVLTEVSQEEYDAWEVSSDI